MKVGRQTTDLSSRIVALKHSQACNSCVQVDGAQVLIFASVYTRPGARQGALLPLQTALSLLHKGRPFCQLCSQLVGFQSECTGRCCIKLCCWILFRKFCAMCLLCIATVRVLQGKQQRASQHQQQLLLHEAGNATCATEQVIYL